MLTTIQILDMLKDKLGSDYRTGKVLNITQPRVSKLRRGLGIFTNAQGVEAARILGLKEEYVILSLAAERENNRQIQTILQTLADKFEPPKAAAAAVFALALTAPIFYQILPTAA